MGIIFGKLLKSVEEDVVSEAVQRKATEDHENPQEKCRRLDSIPCDNELDVVSEAVKRKATEDHENPQEKCRRLDILCDIELPSNSGDPESRSGPVETTKRTLDLSAMFEVKYQQQEGLGEGGFGFVFAGYRKADNLAVVIKHIPRDQQILYHEDDTGKQIPMEVAVMLKLAAEPERHSAHIDLLDWYELDEELILVLERPMPAVDLLTYITAKGGCLTEKESKIIMRQLVDAAIDLQKKHIFHRHIKVENLLIQTCLAGIRVRIIDFGASCFFKEGDAYEYFMGTHIPPEWYSRGCYTAEPSTVYQVGAVLVDMVQNPTFEYNIFYLQKRAKWWLSENCKDFLNACLKKDPDQRLTLEQLRNHLWMR